MSANLRSQYNFLYSPLRTHAFKCVYCGEPSDCRDHVYPISKVIKGSRVVGVLSELFLTVPACRECNTLAGDYAPQTFDEKLAYVRSRLMARYSKLLRRPDWTEDELDEMSGRMREQVKLDQFTKSLISYRVSYNGGLAAVLEHAQDRRIQRGVIEEVKGEATCIPAFITDERERETGEVWEDIQGRSVGRNVPTELGVVGGGDSSSAANPLRLVGSEC